MGIRKALVGLVAACSFGLATAAANAGGGPSWNGLYLGGQVGYGWGNFDTTHTTNDFFSGSPTGLSTDLDVRGPIGGLHGGYNLQFGSMVVGVEVAYNFASIRDHCTGCLNPVFATDKFFADVNDLLTVTGRLGYATPTWLIYAKGGWANSEIEYFASTNTGGTSKTFSDRVSGWTAGGGAEFKVTNSLSLGVEYMFVRFDNDNHTLQALQLGGSPAPARSDVDIHTVMARLSYQLGK